MKNQSLSFAKILTILIISLFSGNQLFAQLNGTYTIGGVTPDYATFTAAVNALTSSGINGPVVFNVRTNNYPETITIPAITGSSVTNTVTFQSEVGDSSQVILTSAGNTLTLNGCDYFIFREISIWAVGAANSCAVTFANGSTYNQISNCCLENATTSVSSTTLSVVYCNNSASSNNTVQNNVIKNGSYGIYYYGSSTAGIQILNNNIYGQYAYGMYFYSLPAVIVRANTITSTSAYTSYYAMYLESCNNNIAITKNRIQVNNNGYYGIYQYYCYGTSLLRGLVANNFISCTGGAGTFYGTYIYYTTYQNYYYNSINLTRSGASNNSFYQVSSSGCSNLQLQNNIFSNTGSGYAIYIGQPGSVNISDYNDLYSNGSYLGYWNGNRADIVAWRTGSSMDMNSVSILPEYVSGNDLHVQAYALDNKGQTVTGVTDDIDNQVRNITTPDVGADEWSTPVNDAGLTSIDQGLTYCITSDSVFVTLKNYGTANLTSCTVNWKVNGLIQAPKSWTGNLTQGSSFGPFSLGYYNFNLGTQYSVIAWTTLPNGLPEGFHYNDTVKVLNKYQAMSGTYTIGGATPNYATINAAVTDLVNGGVCGPVIFNIRPGTYNEQVSIADVAGTSLVNNVTFKAENNDSTSVIITSAPTVGNNYTVRFYGCDYVTFKKVTIRATGASYSIAARFDNASTNCAFKNNVIEGSSTTLTNTDMSVVFCNTSTCVNNTIDNNVIKNGSYGVYYYGSSTAGIQILNNNIYGQYYHGAYLYSLPAVIVRANTITSTSAYTSYYAMYLESCNNNIAITKNRIQVNNNGYYGIYQYYCYGTSLLRGLVANNFISCTGGAGTFYGTYIYYTTYQNYYYNSINLTRSGASNNSFYQVSSSGCSNLQLQNNIFSNTGSGYAIYIGQPGSVNISNYNDFYSNGSYLGYWNGNRADIVAWRTASSQDLNSVSILPEYFSGNDLHTQAYQIDNLGFPVSEVTDDIDGQVRNLSTPDMGADEWSTPVNDAGLTSIDQGLTYCITSDSVFVTLKNYGTANLTSCTVNWKVNGLIQAPKSWTGNLTQGSSFGPFSLGYYNFNLGTQYSVIAWTTLPNGLPEGFHYNDTVKVLNKYQAMSGTYTIGGATPNYATINAAVTDLVNGGVCGPVIFNIRPGTYNEQVSIADVAGTSLVNNVTFKAENNDSTSVIITSAPTVGNNYTVRFYGCDYVTFKKVTIRATGASYSIAARFDNASTNCAFKNNVIEGSSTTLTNTDMSVVFCNTSTCVNNTIDNNVIKNGSYGVYYYGSSTAGIQILNNNIYGQYYHGAYLYSLPAVIVRANTITSTSAYTSYYAMYLESCNNNIAITKNRIQVNNNGYYGIYQYYCYGTSLLRGLVANNFISCTGGAGTFYGTYIYYTTYQNYYYNSINLTRSGASNNSFYQVSSSGCSNLQLQNNIFSNTGSGYAIYIGQPGSVNISNYNDFYSNGSYLGYWNGNRADIVAWRTASSQDLNSVSILPEYFSGNDLHTQAYQIDNLGFPVSEVTDDIDGQVRNLSTPDMGADEWSTPVNDAGLTSIDQGLTYCITSDSVFVTLKNYGTANLTSCTVNWKVNGLIQAPKSWTGNLTQGSSFGPFSLGYYNFNLGTQYSVIAWTTLPNGLPEGFHYNDTVKVLNKYQAMSGTYTIGGATPNYATINAAVTDLVNGGVCGPVIFNIRPGTYNEQVSIADVAGTSLVNNVTFKAENNDSTSVIITSAPTVGNNYTVRFYGCDYVTFKKVTIRATGASYSIAARFDNASTNCAFKNNVIEGSSTTLTNTDMSVVFCNTSTCVNNTIDNNVIKNGSYGVYYYGSSTAGIQILNNNIYGQYYHGAYLYSLPAVIVRANTITSTSAYTSYYAMYLESCNNNIAITKNRIQVNNNGYYGIYQYYCYGTSLLRGLVANNFISCTGGAGTFYGTYIYYTTYQNYYYNSINLTRSGASNNSFYQVSSSGCSNLQLQNNIFSNTGSGYAIYIGQPGSVNISNYNDFYSNGSYLGYWNGNRADIVAWRTASSQDLNSVSVLPGFISGNDLHLCNPSLNSAGFPVTEVTDDIDADTRNVSTPDIGADEFNSALSNPGAISGAISVCQSQSGLVYSISAVAGAVSYTWSVPGGWTINSGQGTLSITVTSGTSGGDICVTANNSCGSSTPTCLTISIGGSLSAPGAISGSVTVCSGQAGLTYSISSVPGASSYNWAVPSGWTITGGQGTISITVTAGTTGGDICVTASNICSTSPQTCLTVSISSSISAPTSISGLISVCVSQSGLIYSISAVSGATSYNWTVPSGWIINSGQGTTSVSVTSGTTGGDICVTASNPCATSSPTCMTISIISSVSTPGTITGLTAVCDGQAGLVYSVGAVSGATSYNWTIPAGWTINSGQGTNILNVTAGSNSGSICVTASNACATSSPSCITVNVGSILSTPGPINGSATVCSGQAGLIFSVSAVTGASTYTWTVPAGWTINSGQGTNILNVTASSASGNICVTAGNSCMTTSPSCLSITAQTTPAIPGTISGLDSICEGDNGLIYFVSPVSGATSYSWTIPAGWSVVSGSGTTTITVNAGINSGTVSVTASNSCGTSAASSLTVTVYSLPPVPSITQVGADLNSSSTTGNQWYLNGTIIPGATGQVYTPTQNGNYTVVVTNVYGCSSTSAVFNFNSIGIIDINNTTGNFNVFPNPTNDQITIKGSVKQDGIYSFELYNIVGEKLWGESVCLIQGIIEKPMTLNAFAQGVYILKISNSSESVYIRIVKQK